MRHDDYPARRTLREARRAARRFAGDHDRWNKAAHGELLVRGSPKPFGRSEADARASGRRLSGIYVTL